jgi:hypothetical protein
VAHHREWTPGRQALLALLILNLAALTIWAVTNYERYQTLSLVAGALWTASLTVLGYLRVRAPQETSFPELLGSPPARLSVVLVTVLVLGGGLGMAPRYVSKSVEIAIEPGDVNAGVEIATADSTVRIHAVPPNPLEVRLPGGTSRVTVTAAGFEPMIHDVAVRDYRRGPQRFTVRLTELAGALLIAPDPGLRPAIDIWHVGPDSVVAQRVVVDEERIWRLPAGRYAVIAHAAGHERDSTSISVARGDTVRWRVSLARRAGPATHGTLSVRTEGAGAEVIIRGRGSIGVTPIAGLRLPAGSYTVVVRRSRPDIGPRAAYQLVRTIQVAAGGDHQVGDALVPLSLVRFTIGASPEGVGDYVAVEAATGLEFPLGRADGERAAWLFPGTYRVERRAGGGAAASRSVTLAADFSQPGF